MLQLKGNISIFVSKHQRDPNPTQTSENPLGSCEQQFVNCLPPKVIEIHSNDQNIPMVPFMDDWVYLAVHTQDLDLIDDL